MHLSSLSLISSKKNLFPNSQPPTLSPFRNCCDRHSNVSPRPPPRKDLLPDAWSPISRKPSADSICSITLAPESHLIQVHTSQGEVPHVWWLRVWVYRSSHFGPVRMSMTGHFSSRAPCTVDWGWCQAGQTAGLHPLPNATSFSPIHRYWSPGCSLINILHSNLWLRKTKVLKRINESFYLALAMLLPLKTLLWSSLCLYFLLDDEVQENQHIICAQ